VRCAQVVAKKSWLEVQRAPPVAGGLKHMISGAEACGLVRTHWSAV